MPKESKAQEIGRIAGNIFEYNIPKNWIVTSIDGDTDFGLDYLVQVKDESNIVKYNFFVQLKGIEDTKKIKNNTIVIKLKTHTLNYYRNNGLVLLVACDNNSKTLYYEYLHTILRKLFANRRYIDENEQKEYTIHIPKENILNKQTNINNVLESYAQGVFDIQRKQDILEIHNIEDSFEDSEDDYIEERNISNNYFLRKKGRVYCGAFIPNDFDFNISCLITFKLSNSKNVMIAPNEKTIIRDLFSGYKSEPYSSSRKWLIGKLENEFSIQIGHARLTVPAKVIIDLSDIFDDLFELYALKIKKFEEQLKSISFPISKYYEEGFKLIKIKRRLWHHIHKFAQEHGFRDNGGEWNIFGYDNYFLRVNFKNKDFIWSGNIVIAPEVDDNYNTYKSYDDEIILVWNSLADEKYDRKNNINKILNIEETYKWLINKLIPEVIFNIENNNHKRSFFDKLLNRNQLLTYDQFINVFDISKYIIFDYNDNSFDIFKNNLIKLVNELQQFCSLQDNIFINIDMLKNLYIGIIKLLENTTYSNLSYLHGNLNDLVIDGDLNKINLITAIQNKIENIQDGTTNTFRIDLLLRCYIVIIEDSYNDLDDKIVENIFSYLEGIVKLMNVLKIRKRQLNRFKY
jgi:hypothetical protein